MGKVYKQKRHSCAMCKPHKMGWEPKLKAKQASLREAHQQHMREFAHRVG